MKIVTIRQIADAIEANGLPQATGDFFYDADGEPINTYRSTKPIGSACAAGMAMINLGVAVFPFRDNVYIDWQEASNKGIPGDVIGLIEDLNDANKLSFKEIADRLREVYVDYLDVEFEAEEQEWLTVNASV